MPPRILARAFAAMLLVTAGACAPPRAGRPASSLTMTEYVGWAVGGPSGPMSPTQRRLRAPHHHVNDRIAWEELPAEALEKRLELCERSGTWPEIVASANALALEALPRRLHARMRRLHAPWDGNRDRGAAFVLLPTDAPRAAELRDALLAPPEMDSLLRRGSHLDEPLAALARGAALALHAGDAEVLTAMAHDDALLPWDRRRRSPRVVHAVTGGRQGLARLAFVPVVIVSEEDARLGAHVVVTIFARMDAGEWCLMAASSDPATVMAFMPEAPPLRFQSAEAAQGVPAAPSLVWPRDGLLPQPLQDERFGSFVIESSPAATMLVVEFVHAGDARLLFLESREMNLVSEGRLWSVEDTWRWRAWAVGADGRTRLSAIRSFVQ